MVVVVAVGTSPHAYQCMYERHLHIWAERICKLHIFEPQRVEFFQKRFKEVWQFARCRLIVPYTSFLKKMHRLSQCVDVCSDNELVSVMISGILLISDSIRPTVEPTSRFEPTGSSPLIKLFLSTSLKISFDLQIFIPKIKISKANLDFHKKTWTNINKNLSKRHVQQLSLWPRSMRISSKKTSISLWQLWPMPNHPWELKPFQHPWPQTHFSRRFWMRASSQKKSLKP